MTALEAVNQVIERLGGVRLPVCEDEAAYEIRECLGLLYALAEVIEKAQITDGQEEVSREPEEVSEDV